MENIELIKLMIYFTVYSDELFFLFVVAVSLGFFVLFLASIAAILKFVNDWIPHEKIEENKCEYFSCLETLFHLELSVIIVV